MKVYPSSPFHPPQAPLHLRTLLADRNNTFATCYRLRWMGWESTNVERDAHVIKAKEMQYLLVSPRIQVSIHLIPKLPLHNIPRVHIDL